MTTRSDGFLQTSPVAVGLNASGQVVVSSRETAMKVKNLSRRPRATFCVLSDAFYGEWIQIEGPVKILHLPDAMEPLVEYYRSVVGEHPDWDRYRAEMVEERRVLLVTDIERAGPDVAG